MYAGEPIKYPDAVSRGSSSDWAMPKSVSFAVPLERLAQDAHGYQSALEGRLVQVAHVSR